MRVTLETERLILRPFELSDAPAMFENWASDEAVTEFLTWNPHKTVAQTERIISMWVEEYEKPERLNFAIVKKDGGELIGGIDVVGYLGGVSGEPVIGYCSSRKFWGNGYMTEACKKVLEYLFSKGYKTVHIDAAKDNIRSNRVIQKCGGKFVKAEEDTLAAKNITLTINRYIVTADDD